MIFPWLQDPTLLMVVLATFIPFVSFVLIMVFTRSYPRLTASISIGAIVIAATAAIFLLLRHWQLDKPLQYAGKWLISGTIVIPFGYLLDPVSLLMFAVVAIISLLIQVYSLGYMADDPGFSRYYAFQSLFAWAMLSLTVSSSMLQLYVFWELVGLSSYLLIGFWYEKFSASQAGKKAFVMTRLGDIAFFLGLVLVLLQLGNLNIVEMNGAEVTAHMSPAFVTLTSLLIFGGVVGKSAQFPLLTWLPDAMEGPTPVSALLHSATMVAAGVYLTARLFPFFSNSATAMTILLAIGTISMLLSSTMAMVSRDIKQVWAYSTISQLGFMLMGLAAGGYFAGIFHLTTHAGFKALLFLCSGVLIHHFETNDIFELAQQGSRAYRLPMVCMIIGAASLAGLPPFSGFFSKEVIMGVLAGQHNFVWLAAGLVGAFLTAYYAFRVIWVMLFPKKHVIAHSASEGNHASNQHRETAYWIMGWPLIILALISLVLGFFQTPLDNFLVVSQADMQANGGNHHDWLFYVTVFLGIAGVALAWFEFGRTGSAQIGFVERIPALETLFLERWYLDHFYRLFVDYVVYGVFSNLSTRNDRRIIDGSIDGICRATVGGGWILSFLQSGKLHYNLGVMFAVLGLVALFFFFV